MHFSLPSALVLAATLLLPTAPVNANGEATIVSRSIEGERLNELGIWKLGTGKGYEIFVTNVAGKAACYRAEDLDLLWEIKASADALTAPVIGNFMGTGSPVLAFGSSSGSIYFLWPGTGETIATLKTEMQFSLPPAVAKTPTGDKLVLGDEQGRIAIAALDQNSNTATLLHTISNTLPGRNDFSIQGRFTQPPTSADLNGDGQPEIITVNDSGVLQVVSLTGPGTEPVRYYTRLAQQSRATTLVAAGDLSGTGNNLIALGVDASIHIYSFDATQLAGTAIQLSMQGPAFGASLGHLLIGQLNSDSSPDLLSTANNTIAARYLGNDLNGNQALLDIPQRHLATNAPPFSPAIALSRSTGGPIVVSVDKAGTAFAWEPASTNAEGGARYSDIPVPTAFTPAGDLTGQGKLSMVVWDEKAFQLSVVTLPIDLPTDVAPILTAGGNYSRNGQWGAEWSKQWNEMIAAAAATLEQAKSKLEQMPDDTDSPADPVSMIAGLDPDHPIAEHFRERRSRTSVGEVALLGAVIVVFMVIAGFVIIKLRRH